MRGRNENAKPSSLRAVTAVAVLGVAALTWWWLRGPTEPVAVVNSSTPSTEPAVRARADTDDTAPEPGAVTRLRELRAMSETYRNTTFLMAIREAGFVCHDLRGVSGGVDDAMAWTAACSDMLAYTVRVANSGALAVEPLATYFDGLAPRVDQQQPLPEPQQLQQLPPNPQR